MRVTRRQVNPRTRRRFGVRVRVVVAAALIVAITLTASCAILLALMHQSMTASLDATELARAQDVAAQVKAGSLHGVIPSTAIDSVAVQVIGPTGTVAASTVNLNGEGPMLPHPPAKRKSTTLTVADFPLDTGGAFRVTIEPTIVNNGPGWVYAASSLSPIDAATNSLVALFSWGVPLIVLAVALITAVSVRQALRPVVHIRRRADAIGAADLSQRVPVPAGNDEITRLATTMNGMLARLEVAATRQQQFIGDASHELRGPLTALQTQIDIAISHPNAPEATQTLPRLREQVTRMAILIDDLLFLARSTETSPLVVAAPVDLDELVLAEATRLRDLGGLTVHVDDLNAARVRGSFRDLTRMLRNLGDNAYDHANSTVSLALTTTRRTAQITVTDDGPGIAAEDRDLIFARFGRLDDARTRNTRGGGSGLGLSIARNVMEACGGTLAVQDRPDRRQGAMFVARMPLSE